ncbi:hypothetical protein M0G74_07480 [Microbulbifer sp. CAU 1566]|uniref:hypothetical protein n=1 Tax=unclassified Microbulbifer TaxID=2619833 RepID=UPI0013573AD6|nr:MULTISPECIES: hypothetical protein [unclassified Microbulbifer]MCK7597111.1 hypothetical protein [Microbulbifer sp. CAU 1566]
MNKLVVPAIAIAAIGAYFYYTNLDAPAAEPQPVAVEERIVEDLDAAVAEAKAAGAKVSQSAEEMMASAEGDVFADVPEAMGHALDETSESVAGAVDDAAEAASDAAEEVMDEVVEAAEEVDHSQE